MNIYFFECKYGCKKTKRSITKHYCEQSSWSSQVFICGLRLFCKFEWTIFFFYSDKGYIGKNVVDDHFSNNEHILRLTNVSFLSGDANALRCIFSDIHFFSESSHFGNINNGHIGEKRILNHYFFSTFTINVSIIIDINVL